ncbi:MAG: hypothetical protein KDD61_09325 [Bdellovibrionales bacterium]|nr:hypothetical protein [Bdellovibrionales bacterium]
MKNIFSIFILVGAFFQAPADDLADQAHALSQARQSLRDNFESELRKTSFIRQKYYEYLTDQKKISALIDRVRISCQSSGGQVRSPDCLKLSATTLDVINVKKLSHSAFVDSLSQYDFSKKGSEEYLTLFKESLEVQKRYATTLKDFRVIHAKIDQRERTLVELHQRELSKKRIQKNVDQLKCRVSKPILTQKLLSTKWLALSSKQRQSVSLALGARNLFNDHLSQLSWYRANCEFSKKEKELTPLVEQVRKIVENETHIERLAEYYKDQCDQSIDETIKLECFKGNFSEHFLYVLDQHANKVSKK